MTTQPVFNVRPVGNCLQLVPVPTTPACITQNQICVQQLQNFLNAIRFGTGCIPAPADPVDPDFAILIGAGDSDINSDPAFIDPAIDYRNTLILRTFADPTLATPSAIYNLTQVGFIGIISQTTATISETQLQCIINTLTPTFDKCQDLNSSAAQQIEAAATSLINPPVPVLILSENTIAGIGSLFIKAVLPGIIIATDTATAPYDSVIAYSTCYISSIQLLNQIP